MSGLFGLWHGDGAPVQTAPWADCLRAAELTDGARVPLPLDGDLLFAAAEFALADDAVCLWSGRLDNAGGSGAGPGPAEQVLAAWRRYGETFAAHLEGDFSLAIFDRRQRCLWLARDRLGVRPLVYTRAGTNFLFASDAKPLLAHPRVSHEPDERQLADAVLFYPSARAQSATCFRAVASVAPGHTVRLDAAGERPRRYFDFDPERRLRLPRFEDYAEAYRAEYTAAVRRRLRGAAHAAIAVSGGLDSSFLYCTAQRLTRTEAGISARLTGIHWLGAAGSVADEDRHVRQLEQAGGDPIVRIPLATGMESSAANDVWRTESPEINAAGGALTTALECARAHGASVWLTGHWGDEMLDDSDYLGDLWLRGAWRDWAGHRRSWRISPGQFAREFGRSAAERGLPEAARAWLWRRRARMARPHPHHAWLEPWYTPRFRALLAERFAAPRLGRPHGTRHGWSLYREARRSYTVHCLEWNARQCAASGLTPAFPMLDAQLAQFLMSVPGEILCRDGQRRALLRAAMHGIVPAAIIDRRDKGNITDVANQSMVASAPALLRLLSREALAVERGYLDGAALARQVPVWLNACAQTKDSILAWRLASLAGLELFLRTFTPDALGPRLGWAGSAA